MKMKTRKTKKFDSVMENFYTEEELINAKEKAKLRAKIMLSISDSPIPISRDRSKLS
jgi:hypothetical protein